MFFMFLLLVVNFVISWSNAASVGRFWSESKAIGGSFRLHVWAGYIMAIAGFTMVYGCILLLLLPSVLPMFMEVSTDTILAIEQLSADMLYVLIVLAIIPTGFYIWFKSVANFFQCKTLPNGLVAGWNSIAQCRNTVNACRELPSALGRIASSLFGSKGKKKSDTVVIVAAIFVLILAFGSGYFTASAIMKHADREYDAITIAERYIQRPTRLRRRRVVHR